MRQRIANQLENLPIEFGFRTDHLQVHLLGKFERQIAHDAWQLRPSIADRLHARLHDAFLQLGGHVAETL